MKYTIEIDSEMVGKIIVDELARSRKYLMSDLKQIEAGGSPNVFTYGDPAADKIELQRYLDAYNLVLDWYCTPEQLKEIFGD